MMQICFFSLIVRFQVSFRDTLGNIMVIINVEYYIFYYLVFRGDGIGIQGFLEIKSNFKR